MSDARATVVHFMSSIGLLVAGNSASVPEKMAPLGHEPCDGQEVCAWPPQLLLATDVLGEVWNIGIAHPPRAPFDNSAPLTGGGGSHTSHPGPPGPPPLPQPRAQVPPLETVSPPPI